MTLFRHFVLILLLAGAISKVACAETDKYVRVATLFNYPPYCFYKPGEPRLYKEVVPPGSDAKSFQGLGWDILRESYHARGYTIELIITPWARAMSNVRDGTADILFPAALNEERSQYFLYSRSPVKQARFRIYTARQAEIKWQGLESLKGMTVGMVRGYYLGDEWRDQGGIKKYPVSGVEQGFHMLYAGRLEGFAGYEATWDYILRQMGWQDKFDKLPVFGTGEEYLVGLKTNPKAQTLLNEFDAGMQEIMVAGEYQTILQRWR